MANNSDDNGLSEDEKEHLKDVVNNINKDIEMPPYDNSSGSGYSREYKEFRKDENDSQELSRYEKFCYKSASILSLKADESAREKLNPAIKLMQWEITPGMVLSATTIAGILSMLAWFMMFGVSMATGFPPFPLVVIGILAPLGATVYIYYLPVFAAKNKVIRSSGEMILSILYMVIYMRSSANLEGAIRFAALNLDGPISTDLKRVLWDVESGQFNSIDESLQSYTERWKDYNKDYIQSINLLRAALHESNPTRKDELLKDSIDSILDGTKEKMKHYAQNLETPVMIINAIGALLPVLGMIMLPLVSAFLGGAISPMLLLVLFNIMLPSFLWVFMQKTLSSRPPTVSSKPADEEHLPKRGNFQLEVIGKEFDLPAWPVGLLIFLLIGAYGLISYALFPHFYPLSDSVSASSAPSYLLSEGEIDPFMTLLRSMSITFGLGMGIGVTKYIGNQSRKKAEDEIREIEQQFPNALFELGNKVSGGTPIELALEEAADSADDLRISNLFQKTSDNVKNLGMTFEEAVFDENYGSLQYYPSKTIQTVMRAIQTSSEKGTKMASEAMLTISRYLKNIHDTQEQLNDLMDETTTTIQMLAYMLAPVISAVAVGMSQTIITALYQLGQSFQQTTENLPDTGGAGGGLAGPAGPDLISDLDQAIPPEALQFVVGIYLIQLLYILGVFYTKITQGEDQTYKNITMGKIMMSGLLLYTIGVTIVSLLFGNMVSGLV